MISRTRAKAFPFCLTDEHLLGSGIHSPPSTHATLSAMCARVCVCVCVCVCVRIDFVFVRKARQPQKSVRVRRVRKREPESASVDLEDAVDAEGKGPGERVTSHPEDGEETVTAPVAHSGTQHNPASSQAHEADPKRSPPETHVWSPLRHAPRRFRSGPPHHAAICVASVLHDVTRRHVVGTVFLTADVKARAIAVLEMAG
jgi:hypothetical protein